MKYEWQFVILRNCYFCKHYLIMKKFIIPLIAVFITSAATAQPGGNLPPLDKSPMDISYYPLNHPVLRIQEKAVEPLIARVIYSRPMKSGRTIFGGLVEYGKIWRLGANEATEIEFYRHVKIGTKKIQKGRYTLYALVNENTWTIIINKETDIWGAFKYDVKKDVVRMEVPVQNTDEVVEAMAIFFEKSTLGANLIMTWENVRVTLPITF